MRSSTVYFVFGFLVIAPSSMLGQTTVHRLVVAANPALNLDNEDVDSIARGMSRVLRSRDYSWGESCQGVKFVREGDVLLDSRIPPGGTYNDLANAARSINPKINVVMGLRLTCAGVETAGCGPVGGEPMVVTPSRSFENILWLHERGHSVGSSHAPGEGSLDSFVPENIGKRVMFWMLGTDHTGVDLGECTAFKSVAIASAALDATDTVAAATTPSSIDRHGLTEKAFAVIGPPWVHGMPIEVVKTLSDEDLQSIRKLLDGEPNELWSNAINVLAYLGKSDDALLIKRALNLPLAATVPGASAEARAAVRTLLQIKLAAPTALGILANKTGESPIDALTEITSSRIKSEALVGKALSDELVKSALTGLAISNRPEAKNLVEKAIQLQTITQSTGAAIKLSPADVNKIDSISKSLPAGLNTILRSPL